MSDSLKLAIVFISNSWFLFYFYGSTDMILNAKRALLFVFPQRKK